DWYVTTLVKTPGHAPADPNPPTVPADVQILNAIDQPGGPAKVTSQLEEARRRDPNATLFPEGLVNVMGYEHLQSGDAKTAIDILKPNAAAYPNAPNVYDSLSDSYLPDPQKDHALQHAQHALALLPSDTKNHQQLRHNTTHSA